jgi:heat shock protein HslJ
MFRRTLRRAFVLAALAVAGCSSSESPSAPNGPQSTSPIGATWQLSTLDGQPVLAGTTVTAEFTSDSRVAGSSGCNRYVGYAEAAAGQLNVGTIASTRMACGPDGVMAQETRYLTALQAATVYSVSGGELRLGASSTAPTLVFTAK